MANELVIFSPIKAEMSLEIPALKAITKIETEQGALVASLGLKKLTSMLGMVESMRKSAKQPHIEAGKLIDDHCKEMVKEPEAVQSHLKRVLLDWNAQETKRKEVERRRLEEEKRLEDERRALEAARDITPPTDDFDSLLKGEAEVQRETIIHQENAKVEQFVADKKHSHVIKQLDQKSVKGVRKVWRFAITDARLVPREYLTIDQPTVNEAIRGGAREIPGLRIFEEEILAARG